MVIGRYAEGKMLDVQGDSGQRLSLPRARPRVIEQSKYDEIDFFSVFDDA